MAQNNNRSWKIAGIGATAQGTQLLLTRKALAHVGSHGDEAEQTATPAAGEHHMPSSEAAADASSDMPMEAGSEAPKQEVPVTQASPSEPVSRASVSEGFSIGLGESLLGVIIAGPFLIASLKKRLRS